MTDALGKGHGYKAVYNSPGTYDAMLLPHYYSGAEDIELIASVLAEHYGPPRRQLNIAEFGCGTGRITEQLAPYARRLVAIDSSPVMLAVVQKRFPPVQTRCLDIRRAVTKMLNEGLAGAFELIGAFWSLSYPLGEYFETITADGIDVVADEDGARRKATEFVRDLLRLVSRNGHLLVLFFDAESREQRLVTQAWEKIAPFPRGGRSYTRHLLADELRAAEDRNEGWLTHTRMSGVAVAPSREAARRWFNHVHFKSLSALLSDPEVQTAVAGFVDEHSQPSGEVILPSGVHLFDFHADRDLHHHLPRLR